MKRTQRLGLPILLTVVATFSDVVLARAAVAQGHYDSMYGRISSAWAVKDGVLTYKATIPANTTATVSIPAASKETVREGAKEATRAAGVRFVKHENGKAVFRLESGSYEFSSRF